MKLRSDGTFKFSDLQKALAQSPEFKDLQFPSSSSEEKDWLAKLIEHKKKLGRQVRKKEEIPINRIVEMFLMIVSFASYREISVQEAITVGYPGFCIYCGEKICDCTRPGVTRPLFRLEVTPKPNLKITLSRFQRQDWKVYPNDKSFEAKLLRAMHLSEEVDEWSTEFLRSAPLEKLFEEIGDVLERLFSLASTFEIDLGKEIARFVNSRLK